MKFRIHFQREAPEVDFVEESFDVSAETMEAIWDQVEVELSKRGPFLFVWSEELDGRFQ